ncbi:lysophospholipid acyltransferase family protein [Granulicoccus phenolivorans]|uniref:lysophospholipid acyltransferase family protein n=1 Tax=Granulicoccus phenolivorans TaxID=266854 RepID=UPI000402BD78|nr:lysophospholipid acyltransferase family protein [Granulicoccus phenolivorans]
MPNTSDALARRPLRSVDLEPGPVALRRTVAFLGWVVSRGTHLEWRNQDRIPRTGGVLVAPNHIGNFDPVVIAHFIGWAGRMPYALAKRDIFRTPLLGSLARASGQIPVDRGTADAINSVRDAVAAVNDGKCVVVYTEGTITSDPEGWPMSGRTGAARIALESGCPVIPVGQWGAQHVLGGKKLALPKWGKPTITVSAGEPVDLSDLRGPDPSRETLQAATDRILDAITDQVADIRGEQPPPGRWNHKLQRRVLPGE